MAEVDAAAMLIAGVFPPLDTTGAVPVTDVTVPPLDGLVFVTVIAPDALVMEIPVPADSVVRVNPDPLPMSNAPFAGVDVRPVPPEATARVADKPAAVPVVFWFNVGNVQFAKFPDVGVPSIGVTSVGLVDKTLFPEPVEVVTPVPPLATGSVPVTPVVKGKPVALVNVADVGVPRIGVTNVGLVESTLLPEPVEVVTPVPPLATGSVPVTPVVKGKPVVLVSTPDVGVPSRGVTRVGLVDSTVLPEPVEVVTPVPPLRTGNTPVRLDTTLDVTLM